VTQSGAAASLRHSLPGVHSTFRIVSWDAVSFIILYISIVNGQKRPTQTAAGIAHEKTRTSEVHPIFNPWAPGTRGFRLLAALRDVNAPQNPTVAKGPRSFWFMAKRQQNHKTPIAIVVNANLSCLSSEYSMIRGRPKFEHAQAVKPNQGAEKCRRRVPMPSNGPEALPPVAASHLVYSLDLHATVQLNDFRGSKWITLIKMVQKISKN
jgi:hypothetical protein